MVTASPSVTVYEVPAVPAKYATSLVVKAPMAAVAPVPEAVVLEPALNQLAEVVSQVPVPPSPAVEPLTSQKRLAARAAGGATASMAAAANSDARLIRGRGF